MTTATINSGPLGDPKNLLKGESSSARKSPEAGDSCKDPVELNERNDTSSEPDSELEPDGDSSDILSTNSEEETILERLAKRQQKGQKGKSLKASV